MTNRTLEAIDQKQREEKPLKLAVIELAGMCRELERQLRQKDIDLKQQEQMAKLGEAALKGTEKQWCNNQSWCNLEITDCGWQDFCKLRKEMGK